MLNEDTARSVYVPFAGLFGPESFSVAMSPVKLLGRETGNCHHKNSVFGAFPGGTRGVLRLRAEISCPQGRSHCVVDMFGSGKHGRRRKTRL